MQRTPVTIDLAGIPAAYHPFLINAPVYDSSCSPQARVLFIDKDGGYYLKSAPKGTLEQEAALTRYFHQKGLAAQVLSYRSEARDWLLTARVPGEDCTHAMYLEDPKRLCDMLAERLRMLHEMDAADCPVDHIRRYKETAERNHRAGCFDNSLFADGQGYASAGEAWQVAKSRGHLLRGDTLLHGDYCLPNVMLHNWRFSGFIDLGNGGRGDRHVDLFWGIWSMGFNLKTDKYRTRFIDAYGRDRVDEEMLRVVSAFEVFG